MHTLCNKTRPLFIANPPPPHAIFPMTPQGAWSHVGAVKHILWVVLVKGLHGNFMKDVCKV